MSVDIRLPNITGKTEMEQLAQIKSYLYQFAGQLQWALKTVESGGSTNIVLQQGPSSTEVKKDEPVANFNQLKSLIIKTADVVTAYEEKLNKILDLDGEYIAQSPFGTFIEGTNNTVSANSKKIEQDLVSKQANGVQIDTLPLDYYGDLEANYLKYNSDYVKGRGVCG